MAEIWIVAWFVKNWEILLSVVIVMGVLISLSKVNSCFDNDPKISPQEAIKSIFYGTGIFVGVSLIISLMIGYYI